MNDTPARYSSVSASTQIYERSNLKCREWLGGNLNRFFGLFQVFALLFSGCYSFATEYSPGYTETAFEAIQLGDPEDKVLAELGEPLWVVGHRFYYFYRGRDLIFLVNTKSGNATITDFCRASNQEKSTFTEIASLKELKERLGVPERVIGVDLGQTDDENLLSYIYSRGATGGHWNYRKLDIDKLSRKVVRKVSKVMSD